MLRTVQAHASYANVMATVAVFVAVGGTSYAAITLPRDSVGQREIKRRAVGSSELRRGAVTSRVLRNDAIQPWDLSRTAGGGTYLNPGAWFEGLRYAVATEDGAELRQFNPGAPPPRAPTAPR